MSDLIQLTRETFNELVAERDGARRERDELKAEVERLNSLLRAALDSREFNKQAADRLRAENADLRNFAAEVRGFVARYSPSELSFGVLAAKADEVLLKHPAAAITKSAE